VTDGLAATREVILFNNAGISNSSGEVPTTFEEMGANAIAFLKALGLKQVDVLGFSIGGFVAQEITLQAPELVRRLVLVGTGHARRPEHGDPHAGSATDLRREGRHCSGTPRGPWLPTSTKRRTSSGACSVISWATEAADRDAEHINLLQSQRLRKAMALAPISSNVVGTSPELLEMPSVVEQDHLPRRREAVGHPRIPMVDRPGEVLVENERHATRFAGSDDGRSGCRWPRRTASARSGGYESFWAAMISSWSRPSLLSRHRIGQERQGCSRAIDVVLYRGRPAQSDRPDNFSVHLNGKPSTPRRHARKRWDTGQKRRVALDKVEKSCVDGNAEQSCIRLILRHLDGKDRGPIHPAKGLEITAVIEDRYVLGNAKFSGFRHRLIHHFLGQLGRDAVVSSPR